MDEYRKANQQWWNEAAQVHAQGEAYQCRYLAAIESERGTLCFMS